MNQKEQFILLLFMTFLAITSCSKNSDFENPNIQIKDIENDFVKWWTYHNSNIKLSSEFIAIDDSSNIIGKENFFKELVSGNFIPLKLISKDSLTYYKLYKFGPIPNKDIKRTIKNTSSIHYKHFKMEGKYFPNFEFEDLNGIKYNSKNTKDKIVILKCWFIACKPCIAEFPKLNELVEKFEKRTDLLFISLAFDSTEELNEFFAKNSFNYSVVADQEKFMTDILNVSGYPTHFIIDKGIIKKVTQTADELISELENNKAYLKNEVKVKRPPPPPPSK